MTCDEIIGQDVTELFNYLTTGFIADAQLPQDPAPRPKLLKKALLVARSNGRSRCTSEKGGGLIQLKMNALEDGDIVKALYRASQAGVQVDLIIRDTCRLRPGIAGLRRTSAWSASSGAFWNTPASTISATAATRNISSARPTS